MARHEVNADITGMVFKIEAEAGATLAEGDMVMILESMKMEIPVEAPVAGRLTEILVKEGDAVAEGQTLAVIEN